MLLDILKQVNAVDLLVAIILIRISYVAVKTGLLTETFKLLGTVSAIYLSFHYFTTLADFARGRSATRPMTIEFLDFMAFLLLALLGYGFFIALRLVFGRLIKAEAMPRVNKVGGLILGVLRGLLTASLVVFMLIISSIGLIKEMAVGSYSGRNIYKISFSLYRQMWDGFFSKVMTQEKFNDTLLEIEDGINQK